MIIINSYCYKRFRSQRWRTTVRCTIKKNSMKEKIIEKLKQQLDKGINSEAECIYLLTQVRKYLEQESVKDFWNLKMCANWALHTTLDNEKNPTVRICLEEVNGFLIDAEEQKNYDVKRYPALQNKLLFFTAFEVELKKFIEEIGIDTVFFDDRQKIIRFKNIYEKVIEDAPLVCKATRPLSHFAEISLSRRKEVPETWCTSLYWAIKRNSGKVLYIKIEEKIIPMGLLTIDMRNFIYIENTN